LFCYFELCITSFFINDYLKYNECVNKNRVFELFIGKNLFKMPKEHSEL